MAGGGFDREWLAPLDDNGNRVLDNPEGIESVGQHAGLYAGLNVLNPQPDYDYYWALNTDRGRLQAKLRGGQIVQADDHELAYYNQMRDSLDATPLDSAQIFGDVVLVRTPIERRRMELEENEARARGQLRNAPVDFAQGASGAELSVAHTGGRPTRFMRQDHMLTFENSDGQTVDQWDPDSGIVRERA